MPLPADDFDERKVRRRRQIERRYREMTEILDLGVLDVRDRIKDPRNNRLTCDEDYLGSGDAGEEDESEERESPGFAHFEKRFYRNDCGVRACPNL